VDLQQYLLVLETRGQLHRVKCEVDPELEITEIALRQVRAGGPALLFERVKGSPYPLAINLNATKERLQLGFGEEPGQLGAQMVHLLERLQPPSLAALWKSRNDISRMLSMRVKRLGSAAVQEKVHQPVDLGQLPVLKCWPEDGGRFITLPLVATASPATGKQNLGMYRMQVFGPAETGMHWQIVRGTEGHAHEAGRSGRLPCAVALGGDPALTLSAIFPLPEGVEELPFAGLLRGKPQPVVRAKTQPLWVPADAEFILEGEIDLKERRQEGPFGDHFGHYSHAAPYPVFKLTALTSRRKPVYPATVVGKPPQEDRVWGEAVNQFSAPVLKLMHPEIDAFWTYYEAGFHNLLAVAVHQRHAKEGVKTALGLLGQGQLSLCKVVVLVDSGVNPADFKALLREARKHFDPREDVLLLPGTPLDTLDFTSFKMNLGSKLILDFTSGHGIKAENLQGPERAKRVEGFDPSRLKRVLGNAFLDYASLEGSLLAVKVETGGRGGAGLLQKILKNVPLGSHKLVALVSPDIALKNSQDLIWGLFTRFDAARDLQFTQSRLLHAWPLHEGVCGIDATWKRGYPDPLEMPQSIVKKVDSRWKEYGFA
jgi:4-hydroxy-3-polyprenylbenzoate decarboxylase